MDIESNVDQKSSVESELRLKNIIGRSAITHRKNIFYDYMQRCIYFSGANVIISTFSTDSNYHIT